MEGEGKGEERRGEKRRKRRGGEGRGGDETRQEKKREAMEKERRKRFCKGGEWGAERMWVNNQKSTRKGRRDKLGPVYKDKMFYV